MSISQRVNGDMHFKTQSLIFLQIIDLIERKEKQENADNQTADPESTVTQIDNENADVQQVLSWPVYTGVA